MSKYPFYNLQSKMRTGYIPFLGALMLMFACLGHNNAISQQLPTAMAEVSTEPGIEGVDYFLPHIDLNNWKVTLPIAKPKEIKPPEILDYASMPVLQEYMYNDSTDGSLVFYTSPGITTSNTKYSRTELREQIQAGSNKVNWTFAQGGKMKGQLKMDDISKADDGKYHRTIIMQIHGRLTNEQKDLIGKKDNDAPPILKIYWNKGKIRVLRKVLKDLNVNDTENLSKKAWTDEGHWFDKKVGFDKFELEVIASDGRLEIVLDGEEKLVFDDIHMEKWGVFENYFKAGNYLNTRDEGAFARVKYYSLAVEH